MLKPLTVFILAGEPSGDRIAADLVRRLRARADLSLRGVGGPELAGEGLQSLFPMSDLSVMGISDVLKRLPLLLWRIEQTARAILAQKPDIVVLVDAQEFSARLARRLRKAGFKSPILLYVAPSVWAREPERAARLTPLFDEVLAVLPFEPKVMRDLGGPKTVYVGHPAIGDVPVNAAEPHRIALLPGSRMGELRRQWPLLKAVATRLHDQGHGGFFLPTLPALLPAVEDAIASLPFAIDLVTDRSQRRSYYAQTRLALVTSGTATLELALAGVPMVISYVLDPVQARRYVEIGRPRAGLPNIVLGEDAVPEFIIPTADHAAVLAAAEPLLESAALRQNQMQAFTRLRGVMEHGVPGAARVDPAERVLAHVRSAGASGDP